MLSTKGRRKIEVDGRPFVWHVAEDFDSPYKVLQVASYDKHMILAVPLQTPEAYVISKGTVFQGNPTSGSWERYALPFAVPDAITPKFVAELIRWSTEGKEAKAVSWDREKYPV